MSRNITCSTACAKTRRINENKRAKTQKCLVCHKLFKISGFKMTCSEKLRILRRGDGELSVKKQKQIM